MALFWFCIGGMSLFLVSPVTWAETYPLPLAAKEVNRLTMEESAFWRSAAWVAALKKPMTPVN